MYRICKTWTFSAAHKLGGLSVGHQCGRLHGHTYTVELYLESEELDAKGMILDFGELTEFEHIVEVFDHGLLNRWIEQPTAENLAHWLYGEARELYGDFVAEVRVWESGRSWASYRGDPAPESIGPTEDIPFQVWKGKGSLHWSGEVFEAELFPEPKVAEDGLPLGWSAAECILLLSGGIDSTTLLAELEANGLRPLCLYFDYGQTLQAERDYAKRNASRYEAPFWEIEVQMPWATDACSILQGSPLDIAKGRDVSEINAETPTSYVPFRNGIFLAYAVSIGESLGIERIFCGGNGLNSGQYWDDTSDFAKAFEQAGKVGTKPEYHPLILFPYSQVFKCDIVNRGRELGVNYETQTWSCYETGDKHCGKCDSCIQRAMALEGVRP